MRVKSKKFYFIIYQRLRDGYRATQICQELNISKQALNYYLSSLKSAGFIAKIGYGTWKILKEYNEEQVKDSSLGTRPITNLHALQINFPILEGIIKDEDWQIKEKLRHWIPKYKELNTLGGLTLKNNNNKSLTVFAKTRNLKDLSEVDNLAFQIRAFIFEFFKNKHGVILDVMNCEVKNLNLATQDKHSEGMIRKGEKLELDLNKKAEKIFEADSIEAKAWIDGSPFKFSAETNDKEWKRAYLQMPFIVTNLASSLPAIAEYNRNILLHMKVQEAQLQTQKDIQALLKELKK